MLSTLSRGYGTWSGGLDIFEESYDDGKTVNVYFFQAIRPIRSEPIYNFLDVSAQSVDRRTLDLRI